jgi:hypothetical protein
VKYGSPLGYSAKGLFRFSQAAKNSGHSTLPQQNQLIINAQVPHFIFVQNTAMSSQLIFKAFALVTWIYCGSFGLDSPKSFIMS